MTEMAYVLCRMMQNYDAIVDYGNERVLKCDIVVTPGKGVNVGFKKGQIGDSS
jgi:hypothetical protein